VSQSLKRRVLALIAAGGLLVCSTGFGASNSVTPNGNRMQAPGITNTLATPVVYTYEVVNTWPHDRNAFTQGLVFLDGELIESTGLNGQSSLRRVELKTGKVLKKVDLAAEYFAEGLAVFQQRIFQLTYQSHKAFGYDLGSFKLEKEFAFDGEGWGLTTDGQLLIASDGTHQLRFLDPVNFEVKRTLPVLYGGRPVHRLNELECIKGEIFANIWGADAVVRINPATGMVVGVIDFSGLLSPQDRTAETDVLNGIAYDTANDRLFVTGKRWPKLFEVRLRPKTNGPGEAVKR